MLVDDYREYWTFVRSFHQGDPTALIYLKLISQGRSKAAERAGLFCLKHEVADGGQNASS